MIDWGSWRNQPVLLGGLIVLGWLYGLAAGPLRGRFAPGELFPRGPALRFYGGLFLLYLAVGSPLEVVARYFLCSVHTVQDMVLLYPAAALLLSGVPAWMLDPLVGAPPGGLMRILLRPLLCGAIFVLMVSGWYVPRLFEGALRNDAWHEGRTALFLGVGLLFWWPLLSSSRRFPRLGHGGRMLYLMAVQVTLTGVFTYVLMAEHALYPTYEHAPRLVDALSPIEDQVLAGTLLSFLSSAVLVGALGYNFFAWARTDRPGAR